jgi:predicted transcriptional regulator
MAKFVIFTNASANFDGDSIAINRDIVASVFELIQPDTNAQLQPRTVIYGVNNIDWQVKEPYLEVLAALNAD